MSPYWAVFRARWRALLTYRAAALAGFATQLFWGWIRVMILEAFYRSAPPGAAPMPFDQVRSFIWLSQATFAMLAFNVEGELVEKVRSGGLAYDLVRPAGLFGTWLARGLAHRTAPTLLRAVPLLVAATLWGGLRFPPDAAQAAWWVVSLAAAACLSAAITAVLSLTLLWDLAGEGIRWLVFPLVWLLSGLVMPIPFFPDRFQAVLRWLPFRGMMDVPCRIWTGHIPAAAAAGEVAFQLGWVAAFAALGAWLAARGTRRLVLQGG